MNLSYLAIAANVPLGFAFAEYYLRVGTSDVPYFAEALRVNQLAAFLELCMEPAFTAVQQNMMYKARAAAEGLSVVLKTLTIFGLIFWAHSRGIDLGVLPFAVGEVVNSITLTAVYWSMTLPVSWASNFSLFPKRLRSRCVYPPQRRKLGTFIDSVLIVVRKSNTSLISSLSLCFL